MKIAQSVQKAYSNIAPLADKLKEQVDKLLNSQKKPSWHFVSRIKSLQSYALKLETGRCRNILNPEDFFACTIVVENLSEVESAVALIGELFEIKYRKPKVDRETHKGPWSFEFDDLRLYVTLRKLGWLPEGQIHEMIFELQIKTFLQHAWSIATHDLAYKSEKVSWPKQRVAFQIKAMLEQAEVAISGAEALSSLPELDKQDSESRALNESLKFLVDTFPDEALPKDLLRLARIVYEIRKTFKLGLSELQKMIEVETEAGRGAKTLNLSPYGILIQSIINQNKRGFEAAFESSRSTRNCVFVPAEIDLSSVRIENPAKLIRS